MKLKVLVVDDDDIVVMIHTTLIKKSKLDLNPLSFSNGKDVLAYLSGNQNPDQKYLVFLDINMPEVNGWDFMDAINIEAFTDQIFIVMVTSSINKIDKEKAKSYHKVIAFLEKPMKKEDCEQIMLLPEVSDFFQG